MFRAFKKKPHKGIAFITHFKGYANHNSFLL